MTPVDFIDTEQLKDELFEMEKRARMMADWINSIVVGYDYTERPAIGSSVTACSVIAVGLAKSLYALWEMLDAEVGR